MLPINTWESLNIKLMKDFAELTPLLRETGPRHELLMDRALIPLWNQEQAG